MFSDYRMHTEDFKFIIEDPLKIEPIQTIKTELENTDPDPLIIDVEPSSRTNEIKIEPESGDNLDLKVLVSANGSNDLKDCKKKSRLKSREDYYACDKCQKTFKNERLLSKHQQYCKRCDECGEILTSKKSFILHKDNNHSKTWNCEKCNKYFKTYKSFLIHFEKIHGNCQRTFICQICKKTTTTRVTLRRHMKNLHHGIKRVSKFECDICENRFTNGSQFKLHMISRHSYEQLLQKVFSKKFQCQKCKKSLGSNFTLKRHLEVVHHGLQPFSCNLCEKSFKQSKDLKLHIDTIHHGIKFPCGICSRVFDLPHSLYKHKRFKHLEILKILKYECDICEKKFTDARKLKGHMVSKHSFSVFKCDFCEIDFTARWNLKEHISSVHEKC